MPNDHASKLWWVVPVSAFLVLVVLALVFGSPPQQLRYGTSYDASGKGFRAAYLLLEGLNYPVFRQKRRSGLGKETVCWVLFPTTGEDGRDQASAKEIGFLDHWVREGGLLLLADDNDHFARAFGLRVQVTQGEDPGEEAASGLGVTRLAGGKVRVDGPKGEILVTLGGRPAVTVCPWGRGEVWLVNRPELLTNRGLRQPDNATLVCRLATKMLQQRQEEGFPPSSPKLAFDEYHHGLRERPGVAELLFKPPAIWATFQGLILLALLLWRHIPRFGAIRAASGPTRRSKEEFLEALAVLLARKGDQGAALQVVRDDFVRQLERELGLPPDTPAEQVVLEATRRFPVQSQQLLPLLTGDAPPGKTPRVAKTPPGAFLTTLNELENLRDECFRRFPRR